MDDSVKVRYDMILGRYLLIAFGLNLKFSKYFIGSSNGPLKLSTSTMIYLGTYEFKYF